VSRTITLIPGDGIGREVTDAARRVIEAARVHIDWEVHEAGAAVIEKRGTVLPDEVVESIRRNKVALKGPIGTPIGKGFRSVNVTLRQALDLYANVRPVRALGDRLVPLRDRSAIDVDMVVFRENTEGIYVGMGGQFKRGTRDEVAINEDVNTRKGVERLIRAGFEYARAHGKRRVHMADKSNAMKHAHELWYRVFFEVAKEYPGIEARHVYVDAMCLYMVQDPSQFEVVVTCNLFGDIVTDLGAALQGGLGMAASANVHPRVPRCCDDGHGDARVALFEPVHGSAPPLAGKDVANPLASFLTVGMMLAHLGWPEEEQRIEAVVVRAVNEKKCTRDVGGELGTRAVGDWVLGELAH
jgi:3-isopropylmalate dehydrogenase